MHYPESLGRTFEFTANKPLDKASKRWESCALVGSSASLAGKGLGPKIEGHFPVIRVNRLPTEEYAADFGKETDLLYGNDYEAAYNVSLLSKPLPHCDTNSSDPKCYPSVDCRVGTPGCPSHGIFFDWKPWKKGMNCARATKSYANATIPVACLSKDLHNFIHWHGLNAEYRGNRTSGGMTAFLAFAPHCKKISLYGFSGAGAADGHGEDYRHSFAREHGLYEQLAAGNVSVSVLAGNLTRKPAESRDLAIRRERFTRWLVRALSMTQVLVVDAGATRPAAQSETSDAGAAAPPAS